MHRLIFSILVLVLLVAPSEASAGTRYASPAGGGDCSQANPCSFAAAVTGAGVGDTVSVGPGDYAVSSSITATVPLTIAGQAVSTAMLPKWKNSTALPHLTGGPGVVPIQSNFELHVSNLRIDSTNAAAALEMFGQGSSVDHVDARATDAGGSTAVALRGGPDLLVTNSLFLAIGGTAAEAVFFQATGNGNKETLRNVTAYAQAPNPDLTTAVHIYTTSSGSNSIEMFNTIATGSGTDVAAGAAVGGSARVVAINSSFASSSGNVTGSGNQTAPPKFVDASGGNFQEALDSPTIGAGAVDPANGTLDLAFHDRVVLGKTDIGAYQVQDTTPPTTAIGSIALNRKGVVTTTLTCPASEQSCAWTYSLRSAKAVAAKRKRKKRKRQVLALGSGSANAAGGSSATLSIKLSKKSFKFIKKRRKLAVSLRVDTTDAAGNMATAGKAAMLKAPKKRKHRRRR